MSAESPHHLGKQVNILRFMRTRMAKPLTSEIKLGVSRMAPLCTDGQGLKKMGGIRLIADFGRMLCLDSGLDSDSTLYSPACLRTNPTIDGRHPWNKNVAIEEYCLSS